LKISYNEVEVSWIYNNRKIKYTCNGIQFAAKTDGVIYIEIFNYDVYERQYVTFKGDLILSHNIDNEEIKILSQDGELKTIRIPLLKEVSLSNSWNIYTSFGEDFNTKLHEYTFEGVLLKELSPPRGYSFYRLGNLNEGINVICRGEQMKADKYGRNDWNFSFDTQKGEWIKQSLAY